MAKFHKLTVTDVQKTIRDAVVVTLRPEDGGDFDFIPGQFLTFRQDLDGTEIRRSYSICAGKDDGILQVGIKRVDGGAFSSWANDNIRPGMVLEAMEPMGNFHAPITPAAEKTYLGFAGGSGITPVLSILKTVLEREPNSTFTLVYANRGVNTIMFREELEALKNTHMERLTLIHVLESGMQDIDLFKGRVDAEKCAALFENWIDVKSVDTAFICGPEPMMLGISKALKAHGLRDDQIKFELFTSGQPGRLAQRPSAVEQSEKTVSATIIMDGVPREITMSSGQTILEAALEHSIDAPYSCRAGVCSTCKCRVLEGKIEMIANHALEDHEVSDGYALSCQSLPLNDKVVVDYDVH